MTAPAPQFDLIVAGGGLAGGLVALALHDAHPHAKLALIEAEETLGGNHVWSCFDSDLDDASRTLVTPLFAHEWSGNEVVFPAYPRQLSGHYASITSNRFDVVVRAALGNAVHAGMPIAELTAGSVTLADGRVLTGTVIDCRGAGDLTTLDLGWQKFVGQMLTLSAPHGLVRPTIMDARVGQIDGYRFVYVLPTGPDTVFVEDTYYSDLPDLDVETLRARIAAYAAGKGWQVVEALHEETGVLPVVMSGDFDVYWRGGGEQIAKGGVRSGLFHPMTSYSLPEAARFAVALSKAWPIGDLHDWTRGYARRRWRANGFYRLLARMLFRAGEPGERYRMLEKFYTLPEPTIGRFYAGRSTFIDGLRILSGKPPVPIGRAMKALIGTRP